MQADRDARDRAWRAWGRRLPGGLVLQLRADGVLQSDRAGGAVGPRELLAWTLQGVMGYRSMDGKDKALRWPLGLLGAVGGGLLGYFAFFWIASQNLYAPALPGAAIGLGCGTLSGGRSRALGIVCGVLALLLGVFAEWRFAPFVDDPGLGFFLMHLGGSQAAYEDHDRTWRDLRSLVRHGPRRGPVESGEVRIAVGARASTSVAAR